MDLLPGTSQAKLDTARRLRRARLRRGLSPEALGALVGVSGRTIRRLESAQGPRLPTARTMVLLADELGEDIRELWYREQMKELV